MKYFTVITVVFMTFAIGACDFPAIFSGDEDALKTNREGLTENLLFLEISGGIAGVHQRLIIDQNGRALYVDRFHSGAKWVVQLTSSQIDDLVNLMLDNHFFDLENQYINNQVADAFFYAISFKHTNQTKTITTNYLGSPANLNKIVDGLLQLINQIVNNGLKLALELSKNEIVAGEKVDLKLSATNTSAAPLKLQFISGQIFEFYAVLRLNTFLAEDEESLIWNWANDKVFTENVWDLILQPGEKRTYQITWDGQDNSGDIINGEIFLIAELVSIPGGSPEWQRLLINRAVND